MIQNAQLGRAIGRMFVVALCANMSHAQSLFVMPQSSVPGYTFEERMSKDGRTIVRLRGYGYGGYEMALEFGSAGVPFQRIDVPRPDLMYGIDNIRLGGVKRDGRSATLVVDETYSGQFEARQIGRDGSNAFVYRNVPWTDMNLARFEMAETGRDFAFYFLHPRYSPWETRIVRSDGIERRLPNELYPSSSYTMKFNGISGDGSKVIGEMYTGSADAWRPVPTLYDDSTGAYTILPNFYPEYISGSAKVITPNARYVFGELLGGGYRSTTARWDVSTPTPVLDASLMGTQVIDSNDDGSVALVRLENESNAGAYLLWTIEGGTIRVVDALRDAGVMLSDDWTSVAFNGLSGDGLSIFGTATDSTTGLWQSFIATIPTPGVPGVIVCTIIATRRRRHSI
jgi:hypothetical protein